jgi:ribonuclease D
MIGLDVETTALTPEDGRLRLIQVAGDRGVVVFDADEDDARLVFRYVANRPAVAHNANFEEM